WRTLECVLARHDVLRCCRNRNLQPLGVSENCPTPGRAPFEQCTSLSSASSGNWNDRNKPQFGRMRRKQRGESPVECRNCLTAAYRQRQKTSVGHLLMPDKAITKAHQRFIDRQLFRPKLVSWPLQIAG